MRATKLGKAIAGMAILTASTLLPLAATAASATTAVTGKATIYSITFPANPPKGNALAGMVLHTTAVPGGAAPGIATLVVNSSNQVVEINYDAFILKNGKYDPAGVHRNVTKPLEIPAGGTYQLYKKDASGQVSEIIGVTKTSFKSGSGGATTTTTVKKGTTTTSTTAAPAPNHASVSLKSFGSKSKPVTSGVFGATTPDNVGNSAFMGIRLESHDADNHAAFHVDFTNKKTGKLDNSVRISDSKIGYGTHCGWYEFSLNKGQDYTFTVRANDNSDLNLTGTLTVETKADASKGCDSGDS